MKTQNIVKRIDGQYGYYENFSFSKDGTKRYHVYHSYSDNNDYNEFVFCDGLDDFSPVHSSGVYNENYNGHACASCYLNFSHTEKLHNKRVSEFNTRKVKP